MQERMQTPLARALPLAASVGDTAGGSGGGSWERQYWVAVDNSAPLCGAPSGDASDGGWLLLRRICSWVRGKGGGSGGGAAGPWAQVPASAATEATEAEAEEEDAADASAPLRAIRSMVLQCADLRLRCLVGSAVSDAAAHGRADAARQANAARQTVMPLVKTFLLPLILADCGDAADSGCGLEDRGRARRTLQTHAFVESQFASALGNAALVQV
jgi:hypothetical protein